MTSKKHGKQWRELTFSQREGEAPLPECLQIGTLTKQFRNHTWKIIEGSMSDHVCQKEYEGLERFAYIEIGVEPIYWDFDELEVGIFWKKFRYSYYFDLLGTPHDKIPDGDPFNFMSCMREIILDGECHEILTVLEHMLRMDEIAQDLSDAIINVFEYACYFVDRSSGLVIILPFTSKEMKENVQRSLDNIGKSGLTGAKSHIHKAGQRLRKDDFADAIRESIHAVEAAARQIDPKASRTLAPALDSLENHGMLKHSALKDAFKKLYGYTSDTKGIRHSLIDQGAADVEFDEAIFMYAACVSFVDYLASKQRQIEEK